MKIYGRKKLIIGTGMLILAVLLIFSTVLSGRIKMPLLLCGAAFIVIGINAICYGLGKKTGRPCDDAEAEAARAVLFVVQLCCIIAVGAAVLVYTIFDRYSGECVGIMLTAGGILAASFLMEWVFEIAYMKGRKHD